MCLLTLLEIANEFIAKCLKNLFHWHSLRFRGAGLTHDFPYDVFVIFTLPPTHILGNTYSLDIKLYKSGFFRFIKNLASTFCSSLVFGLPRKFLLVCSVWFSSFLPSALGLVLNLLLGEGSTCRGQGGTFER